MDENDRADDTEGPTSTLGVPPPPPIVPLAPEVPDEVPELVARISTVLLGNDAAVLQAVSAFLAGGHVLLEDLPGVGKTLLAKAMANAIGGSFGRIQGTADLLPSDVTGSNVLDRDRRTWEFRPGPIFNNVVLVDELNRATPRTQSALLEAMAEGQVTVDGDSHPLPEPFFVIATQNPSGDLGTFPLVSGQRDRFLVSLSLGLPPIADERRLISGTGGTGALDRLTATESIDQWIEHRQAASEVFIHPMIFDYILHIVAALRASITPAGVVSPRASLAIVSASRARAYLLKRGFVTPDDVQAVALGVLAHRIVEVAGGELGAAREWLREFVAAIPVPVEPVS